MTAFTVQLYGCDGSMWTLTDPTSPVQLAPGVSGLHLPPKVTHQWTTTARRTGRTWRGAVTDSRAFTMQIIVEADLALDATFWRALTVDQTSRLVVTGPTTGPRTLTFRLDEVNDETFTDVPGSFGMLQYHVACIADRPEWVGSSVTTTFPYSTVATSNFFGGGSGTKGTPFYISASSLSATAAVQNPGDLPAWPVWKITGPVGVATVGVVGNTVTLPFPLRARDQVVIDTQAQTITDPQGTNLWPQMGYTDVAFAPIPAGDLVPVAVGMDNGSAGASVQVTLTPLYRRAW